MADPHAATIVADEEDCFTAIGAFCCPRVAIAGADTVAGAKVSAPHAATAIEMERCEPATYISERDLSATHVTIRHDLSPTHPSPLASHITAQKSLQATATRARQRSCTAYVRLGYGATGGYSGYGICIYG